MPTRSRTPDLLVDTSVAVPLLVSDHDLHESTFDAIAARRLGLAGHAAFETFSVLTRLPVPLRRTAATVVRMLAANFPGTRYLSTSGAGELLARLAAEGVTGGSVYHALVGAAAAENGLTLVTRDRRALDVYRALGVDIQILADP
ncbi:MAG: type II toxin-antitoxin system VapC family toxin [Actinomycetota bacterium]|nr:type II toxin-antitoxin system VapC family toxin [Actinomycetota bacterium]